MATRKTQRSEASVEEFIKSVDDDTKRHDSFTICNLMEQAVGEPPVMWGPSMVGFGEFDYTISSGTSKWFLIGFSPRKQNLTLYLDPTAPGYDDMLSRLGKHTTGKSCLYIKRLSDVDTQVLQELIEASANHARTSR